MRRLLLLPVLIAQIAHVATPDDLPLDVLKAARAVTVNRELVTKVPSFACLETIRRTNWTGKLRKTGVQDTVQVEVGIGGGKEVFSWPGQNNFSDSSLGEIVGHGLVATGLFQSMVNTVFAGNAAAIKLIDENTLHGHAALHFGYKILSLQNRWEINWLGARANVGEEGEFWVDATNFTLLRLVVNAIDIPPVLWLQRVRITIDYRPESIGITKTLLPESAEVLAVEWNGTSHRDEVSFSHCRVFGAESSLLISAADLAKQTAQFQREREFLPPGLELSLILETPIDSARAMVGDEIRARLEKPVDLPDGTVIPKGAAVEGYVRQFERMSDPRPYYQAGLEFDRIRWAGHSAEFFAEAISLDPIASRDLSTHIDRKFPWGTYQAIESRTETVYPMHIPGVANFLMEGDHVQVPRGFHMVWKTHQPRNRAK